MPGVIQVTVTELSAEVPPLVMVPPADTFHVYPVIPVCVVYTWPVDPLQMAAGPEIAGASCGFTVTL